jgi:hypothetical protein
VSSSELLSVTKKKQKGGVSGLLRSRPWPGRTKTTAAVLSLLLVDVGNDGDEGAQLL